MRLPQTLPAQLYLLAYDARRKRFAFDRHGSGCPLWKFEFAARSAIFTDLYLSGAITDVDGKLHKVSPATVQDPVLLETLSGPVSGRSWPDLICSGGRGAADAVRGQLEDCGWVRTERRTLGVVGTARVVIYDADLVSALAAQVVGALVDILRDNDAPPRPLALGLIAFEAQMPLTEEFMSNQYRRQTLHQLTEAAIEPIDALRASIQKRLTEMRRSAGGP